MRGRAVSDAEQEGNQEYGRRWGNGDLVTVVVDMEASHEGQRGTVRLLVNGEDQGVGFGGLAGQELVPAVWLYGPGDCLETVRYSGPLAAATATATAAPRPDQVAAALVAEWRDPVAFGLPPRLENEAPDIAVRTARLLVCE